LVVALPTAAQAPSQPAPIKLSIRPAAAPVPALKYQLLPQLLDQTPGNAALLYYRTFSPEWHSYRKDSKFYDKLDEWKQAPLHELPRKEADRLLADKSLKEADLAARREQCDWELTDRVRQEGFSLLLPDMHGFRQLATMLAVRARLEIAHGNYDQAIYTLQTGFALARQLNEAPLLFTSLVGMAITQVMAEQVETLIQAPNAPNLYWALTELPQPLIDLRKGIEGERLALSAWLPDLKDLEKRPLASHQVQEQMDRLLGFLRGASDLHSLQGSNWESKLVLTAMTAKFYPEAKKALLAAGLNAELIEAMPTFQVVLIHSMRQFYRTRDELFRWCSFPYWQGREAMHQVDSRFGQMRERMEEGFPLGSAFLPAVQKVYFARALMERRIAAVRCIEAIRLYAASHEGKLPEKLSDMTEVPIPVDPVTGKQFEYQSARDKATLYGPPPDGEEPTERNSLRYELTLIGANQ
jgi:hypothetical protein